VVCSQGEVLESVLPVVVEVGELVACSGGAGRFRGGPGQAFVLRCVSPTPVHVLLRTERLRHPAKGIAGGGDGRPGRVMLNGKAMRGKETFYMVYGDVLHLQTPGGGGYGAVVTRP
jgi:N-methylhydantoinase B